MEAGSRPHRSAARATAALQIPRVNVGRQRAATLIEATAGDWQPERSSSAAGGVGLARALENPRPEYPPAALAALKTLVSSAEAICDVTYLGGGSIPTQQLPTWCVALKPATWSVDRLAAALRTGAPAVVGRVREDRLLLDLRSVFPRQDTEMISALEALNKS